MLGLGWDLKVYMRVFEAGYSELMKNKMKRKSVLSYNVTYARRTSTCHLTSS